jgi:hypothetical protein
LQKTAVVALARAAGIRPDFAVASLDPLLDFGQIAVDQAVARGSLS